MNIAIINAHDALAPGFMKKTTVPIIKKTIPRTHVNPNLIKALPNPRALLGTVTVKTLPIRSTS